jgi:hypothetical protein
MTHAQYRARRRTQAKGGGDSADDFTQAALTLDMLAERADRLRQCARGGVMSMVWESSFSASSASLLSRMVRFT